MENYHAPQNPIEQAHKTVADLSSLGHAYWCELMHPKVLSAEQIQSLNAIAVETQAKIMTAWMQLRFQEIQDIRIAALNRINVVLYGKDFASVTAQKLEAVIAEIQSASIAA